MSSKGPVGAITRGTTGPNRLRRCDRWLVATQRERLLAPRAAPLVVDLGYGASPVTAVELRSRLLPLRPDVRVVGLEIDPARVRAAQPLAGDGLEFRLGGFEVPVAGSATVVRAFNVLRQYDENQVPAAWDQVVGRLAPNGLFIDGTCDEIGRLATWIALDRLGPQTLTCSWRLAGLVDPTQIAQRLPKALIHRNIPGEPIHAFLTALGRAWAHAGPYASYGARSRFLAMAATLKDEGWPIIGDQRRWRLGELTVAWSAVAPLAD
ncbi:class I SAM-dependent methyltransferase [Calidifontibacter terrae]